MREIVFDTETTGFSFSDGDRMVEIGCLEMVNKVETGRTFHAYFHPERTMPPEAQRVHGLSDAFLADKPLFPQLVEDLLDFIGDSPLVAHNASFDFGFLNGELQRCGRATVGLHRMVDTVAMARMRHPGAKHSLDALCNRYGIDRSHRTVHGALLDAQLLSQVYVELTGGRQIGLGLVSDVIEEMAPTQSTVPTTVRPARIFAAAESELARHAAFLKTVVNPLWGSDPALS
ncbi:DNA polymerase III subunit epsilon [Sphingomonas sp. 10B4]|uniref:DNA polymerase III subunit epsilon n=1 Tax=Sphingomonas sp. 10B4 TaxID=3048575 RepID=UPI002AB5316E|nr:DNA polymerase III subunit epsilon [Sphingomonas sp. 10B4]MDY7524081.1 DNA polymerase III subunit epsilon [Sphingomonas sp. 10B4]MEB0281699.1 DNA polymerase III subunit epsilon [Sphingomonas sp. 10B4]